MAPCLVGAVAIDRDNSPSNLRRRLRRLPAVPIPPYSFPLPCILRISCSSALHVGIPCRPLLPLSSCLCPPPPKTCCLQRLTCCWRHCHLPNSPWWPSPTRIPPCTPRYSPPPSVEYLPSSYSLSAGPPLVQCATDGAQRCKGFTGGMCSSAQKCHSRPSPSVRSSKVLRSLHWRQHTQSVHWRRAFRQLQAWSDGPSINQVE